MGVEGGGSDEVEGNGEDGGSDEVEGNGEDGGSDEVEGNGEDGGSDEVEGNGEDGESEEVQGNDENGESEVGGDEIVSPERNGGSSQDDVEASPTKSSDGSGCENSQTPMKDGCDGPASDSDSERNAPTLQLGGSSSEASEEEGAPKSKVVMSPRDASESIEDSPICSSSEGEPDSQVSSGWMGKAHNFIARQSKQDQHMALLAKCLQDIRDDLNADEEVAGDSMLPPYIRYCERTLAIHGPSCYSTLASAAHFREFVGKQKAQDRNDVRIISRLQDYHLYFVFHPMFKLHPNSPIPLLRLCRMHLLSPGLRPAMVQRRQTPFAVGV